MMLMVRSLAPRVLDSCLMLKVSDSRSGSDWGGRGGGVLNLQH